MAQTTATILIPDISGFTEFVTNTELSHSSFAISNLINAIVSAAEDQYEISEIEGDAVLMFKKGAPPSQKEIQEICLKIFNAFHLQRVWMEQHSVCPCKACIEISNLTLKFVVHHGEVGEIKVGRFTKLSGTDMIVAHRLLKNSLSSHEYLLLTEKLLKKAPLEATGMEWAESSEEYDSIGKVEYRYALLSEERKKIPTPPRLEINYGTDATAAFDINMEAHYLDAYMVMMNIPGRAGWMTSLQRVEQQIPAVYVGSIHQCIFNDYEATISPLQMTVSANAILYSESWSISSRGLSLIYECVYKAGGKNNCVFTSRFINAGTSPLDKDMKSLLSQQSGQIAADLKSYCVGKEIPVSSHY